MSADLIERLQSVENNPYQAMRHMHELVQLAGEAAAEIVRLRGEVAERADDLTTAYMAGRFDGKAIAPAEAKGDSGKNVHTEHCCVVHGCKYGDIHCPVVCAEQAQSFPCEDCTPQPAGGEAVAIGPLDLSAPPRVFLQVDTDGDNDDRSDPMPREAWEHLSWHWDTVGGQEVEYVRIDLATPPAAQVQQTDEQIIAACAAAGIGWIVPDEDAEDGGFPGSFDMATMASMRRLIATHPAGDALGAVRERVAKMIYEQWTERVGYVPWVDGGNSIMQDGARSLADAALQHRGDSRGGEG